MATPVETYLSLLSEYENNLALNSQWVLIISGFPSGLSSLPQIFEKWPAGNNTSQLTNDRVQRNEMVGCFFIDSVSLPGEGYSTQTVGDLKGGYIRPIVAGVRDEINNKTLTTTFRETNLDFIEGVIRPWIIMTSHLGYFAYPNEAMRTKIGKISLISYGRRKETDRPVRKIYNFYKCAPAAVDAKRYSYNEDMSTSELNRVVSWTFDNYDVVVK